MRDVAFRDFATDDRAGDDFSFVDDRRDDHHLEAALRSQFDEQTSVAGLLVAEAKIFPDKNSTYVKILDEDLVHKFLRGKLCQIVGERENDGGVHAEGGEAVQALRSRGNAQRG